VFVRQCDQCGGGLLTSKSRVALSKPGEIAPDIDDAAAKDFTHQQAMRTPMFWVCALSISLYGMIVSGISLFNESILVDQGFPKEVYYESLAMGTAVGAVSQFAAGWLGIVIRVNRLLCVSLLLLAVSLVWLTHLSTYSDVVVYVSIKAVSGGILTVMFFSVWPELYGRAHLGKIQGTAQMLTVIASAFGPLVFAKSKAWTGSYHPLLWMLAVLVSFTAIVAWITPLPIHNPRTSGES